MRQSPRAEKFSLSLTIDTTSKFMAGNSLKEDGRKTKKNHNNMGSCALGVGKQFKLLNCQVVRTKTNSSLELNYPGSGEHKRKGDKGGLKIQMPPVLSVCFYHNPPRAQEPNS